LREVAEREGRAAQLVADARAIDWQALEGVSSIAVTAGASAPETLVDRIVEALRERYAVTLETLTTTSESMAFPLPRVLREMA
jgi:4-hydroxy-3-methylbut-2-enyl diphosphate reductase